MRTALGHSQLFVKCSQVIHLKRRLSHIFCHFKRVSENNVMKELLAKKTEKVKKAVDERISEDGFGIYKRFGST
jgi:hypothetical protein